MTENGRCLRGEQMSMTFSTNGDEDTDSLIADMWRCIQASPLAPPALKESIRERLRNRGIEVD